MSRLKDLLTLDHPVYDGRWGLIAGVAYVFGLFTFGIIVSVGVCALGAAVYHLITVLFA
jgi:hypothetical protein